MRIDTKRLLGLAISSMAAAAISSWVYDTQIVPRLPSVTKVPLLWWCERYAPVWLVILAAGALATSFAKVPLYSFAVFGPPTLTHLIRSLVIRAPIMHDVWVGDVFYWLSMPIEFIICTLVVGVAYGCAKLLNSRLGA